MDRDVADLKKRYQEVKRAMFFGSFGTGLAFFGTVFGSSLQPLFLIGFAIGMVFLPISLLTLRRIKRGIEQADKSGR